jgi:hypothetical protein
MQQQPEPSEYEYVPQPCGWVYEIIYEGAVLYVGLSINPERRFKEHRKTGVAPAGAILRKVSFHRNWGEAQAAELARIQELCPPKNKMGVKLADEAAFAIWSDFSVPEKERLSKMWGWTRQTAKYAFDRRMGVK